MNEPLRNILAFFVVIVYTGLIIEKGHRMWRLRKSDKMEGAFCCFGSGNDRISWVQEYRRSAMQEYRILRFGLIRLCLDCLLLLGFILSPLWAAWFGLFPESALMTYTAGAILITVTMILSVLIDWFPVREGYLQTEGKAPPFGRFLVQQLIGILRIESVMAVVWVVLLVLEPTGLTVAVKAVLAVLAVLLLRGLQDLIGKRRKERAES